MGFVIWFLITSFLLIFWGWTSYTLIQQKRSWKAYAIKHKLRYRSPSLFESPEISGSMDGYQVSFFSTDHGEAEGKTRRMMTTLEISLKTVMPGPIAVASGGMVQLVEGLGLTQEYRPDAEKWDTSYIARAKDMEILKVYLTEKRLETLSELMKIKRAWFILIFGGDVGLLRIDTPDPLENIKDLESIVQKLLQAAQICDLEKGEDKLIQSKQRLAESRNALSVDDDTFSSKPGFTLEDEEGDSNTYTTEGD